jgi:hypothetical protein
VYGVREINSFEGKFMRILFTALMAIVLCTVVVAETTTYTDNINGYSINLPDGFTVDVLDRETNDDVVLMSDGKSDSEDKLAMIIVLIMDAEEEVTKKNIGLQITSYKEGFEGEYGSKITWGEAETTWNAGSAWVYLPYTDENGIHGYTQMILAKEKWYLALGMTDGETDETLGAAVKKSVQSLDKQ